MSAPSSTATLPAFNPWVALLLILAVGSLWGSTFSISKLAIEAGVTPLGYAVHQTLGSGLLMLLLLRLRGERLPLERRHLAFYLATGALGVAIPNTAYYLIIPHVPAGLMAIVVTTAPLITFLLAVSLRIERFRWLRAAGIAFGFAGATLLVLPKDNPAEDALTGWLLLGFVTPFFYALNSIVTGTLRPPGGNALSFAAGMMLTAGLLQLPVMLALKQSYLIWPPFGVGDWALCFQILASAVGYTIAFYLVKLAGPVYFSQVGYVVTLTAILWGMIFFGERLSPAAYSAGAVILVGLALVNISKSGRKT